MNIYKRLGYAGSGGGGGSPFVKNPVMTFGSLPLVGNNVGDLRYVQDVDQWYRWTGVAWQSWTSDLDAETVLVTDVNGEPESSAVTTTELGHLSGVTAPIQDQIDDVAADVSDLVTLSGVPVGSTDLGAFTGVTIPDNSDNKEALQALETALEAIDSSVSLQDAYDNSLVDPEIILTAGLGAITLQQGSGDDTDNILEFLNGNGDLVALVDGEGLIQTVGDIYAQGDIQADGNVTGLNLSGTNTGDVTLAAVGAVPNANGASLAGQILNLEPASATFPGVVTTGTQSFAGDKTFTADPTINTSAIQNIAIGNQIAHNSSTGVISGGTLSINVDTTKFNMAAGSAVFVDYTAPTVPTIKTVTWTAFTAQTLTGLAVQDQTYICVDNAGAIVQLSSYPTPAQRRTYAFVGRIGHSSRTFINFANTFPDFSQSVSSQLFDFFDALGSFNVTGNILATNGATLGFQKSAGTLFFRSFNYPTNTAQPHTINIPSAAPVSFFYRTSTVLVSAIPSTNIDVGNYDVAGTVTPIPGGANSAVIHRVFLAPNGVVQIQYGSTVHANLVTALASIGTEPFTINPALADVTVLIGYIVVQKNCTALNDANRAAIAQAGRFSTGASGGVNTVISLQQTYNSSDQPEIILDSTHGALDIYDNTTPLGTSLFTVQNNAGTVPYLDVAATGVTVSQLIDSGLTADTVPYANGSKQLTSSAVTPTELSYLSGVLPQTSFSLTNNQAVPSNVTGFTFANATVRSFEALVSITIDATADLFEEVKISGIQKGSNWDISLTSTGDNSGVLFDITNAGQITYTSPNFSGFSTGTIKFKAITTAV